MTLAVGGLLNTNKQISFNCFRPSLTNLPIVSPLLRRDDIRSPPDKPPGKLLNDDEEEKEKDDSYTTHHPRPIAVGSFIINTEQSLYNSIFRVHRNRLCYN